MTAGTFLNVVVCMDLFIANHCTNFGSVINVRILLCESSKGYIQENMYLHCVPTISPISRCFKLESLRYDVSGLN